jgi:hypothetical protein
MPIEATFHFANPSSSDDYILDCSQAHCEIEVADLSELGNEMCVTTNGEPLVVVARHYFIRPDGELGNEFINAYIIGDKGSYVAVNVGGGGDFVDGDKFHGVVPVIDFDRDYALYLEAVDSCGALEA